MVNDSIGVVRRAWPPTARTAAAIVATAGLALLAVSCGGSPSSTGSGGSSTAGGSPNSQTLAFSHCVQSHGVSNFPDPSSDGQLDKSKITAQHLGVSNSQLQAAENPCQHLLPNGAGGRTRAQLRQEWSDTRSFALCMRHHGVPNWPDPTPYPPHPEDPTFRLHAAGIGFHQGSDTNILNSPQIRARFQACVSIVHMNPSGWFD
jgi:hypothetical protein